MKRILVIFCIFLSCIAIANDKTEKQDTTNDADSLVNLMIVSKATGMCGLLRQMVTFQETTKMPGGDAFIERFLKTEMARLDKTTPEFLKECSAAISSYNKTMEALGFEN